MKMLQKMNRELFNCTGCLLRYIQWKWFLPLTILSGSIYYYLSIRYIAEAATTKQALTYYLSCPPNNNLLYVIAFYIVTFLPVLFALHFFDYKICTEYYSVRLSNKKILIISKVLCVIGLNAANIFLRLCLFSLYNILLPNKIGIQLKDLGESFFLLLILYVTFDLVIFLLYSFIQNAITLFIVFTVLFIFSICFNNLSISIFLFWIYGLNYCHLTAYVFCGDLALLVLILGILFVRHYDIIPKEEEKNE